MSYQICKFQLNESSFLDFRPSQIAAAAIIIAINVANRDSNDELANREQCSTDERVFDTDIWNNSEILKSTGYSIEFLSDVIYKLAIFIQ